MGRLCDLSKVMQSQDGNKPQVSQPSVLPAASHRLCVQRLFFNIVNFSAVEKGLNQQPCLMQRGLVSIMQTE